MKVLWLASWYPNELFPLNGDFVQRHAQAVSLYHEVEVIHLCRDEKGGITRNFKQVQKQEGSFTEKIIYYYSAVTGIKPVDRFLSALKYRKLYKQLVAGYISVNGKPALVHVQVTMNAGLIALWMKKKFGIKYLVTEHWSGLLPEAENSFYQQPLHFKTVWKKIIQQASAVSVVSDYLGKSIQQKIVSVPYTVIPNVVDTGLFKPSAKTGSSIIRFIHISRMDYQKNPEAIFKAFALVKKNNPGFILTIYSNEISKINQLSAEYKLEDNIECFAETAQAILVKAIQQSDALVLFSRYETFGCVVPEANACGLPVIVSDIPAMHELVKENVNGILAAGENAGSLAEKIKWFMANKNSFDPSAIAGEAAEKYNYSKVGKLFSDWYGQTLNP
jgi:glycosyltransferase involved in cell wall biosynthesis